ncbi:MAG TPA: transposase [Alphaproteobacteria bacterium]|nr:transposase [Alphaproteobacteria bacterium]
MNILPRDKQVEAISALCEGVSIRATARLTGADRGTVMNLGVVVGRGCAALHDTLMRDLRVNRVELDELWSFVGKKQKQVREGDPAEFGDQYVFVALAGAAKAIVSYRVGKRDAPNTRRFVNDVRERVIGAPEISSDAFRAYPLAVERAFGAECSFGTIDKTFAIDAVPEAARRYSPGHVVAVARKVHLGDPENISTSYVERQNLTLRMQQRRFTRLTNAFSKKLENHMAAVALYVAHYNFCRVHEALRITPAMQLGVTDHIWTIGELVEAALAGVLPARTPEPPLGYAPFTVIDGGRK